MDELPKISKKNNPATRAMDLPSSADKPDFWDATGTARDFLVTWDSTSTSSLSTIKTMVYATR